MKIAVLTFIPYAIREPYVGGTEVHATLLVKKLVEKGHEVVVYSRSDSYFGDVKMVSVANGSLLIKYPEGIFIVAKIRRVISGLYSRLVWRFAFPRIEKERFDVIINNSHSHDTFTLNMKTPMLTILHGPPSPVSLKVSQHQNAYMTNKTYVSVSHLVKNQWKHLPCHVVYNGIDLDFWKPETKRLIKKPYAVWFGRISPEKGLEFAIKAAKLANMSLKIVGAATHTSYFQESIAPLLDEQVEYLGHFTHRDLCKLIQEAQVALFTPVWDEPFGLVVVEAFACGTPVAAFSKGAFPELITPKVGVLADPENIESLAEALHQAKRLNSEDCIEHAKNWSVDRMVEQYLGIALDLVS